MPRNALTRLSSLAALAAIAGLSAPALANETRVNAEEAMAEAAQDGPPPGVSTDGGPPDNMFAQSVFDETWLSIGVGAGLSPSYTGSDDYRVFPLPLIVGRVAGVGITPNGPGLNFDVLSQPPSEGPAQTSISLGPTFRLRGARDDAIKDDVVALAGELDTALEVGVQGGVRIPGVLHRFDAVTLGGAVRWDVLGAHEGMLIEPSIGYFTPLSRGSAVQLVATAGFVDDNFADYYYDVTPAQSAASGLPVFDAEGGFNSLGVTAISTFDLDGNVLNGGWNIFAVGGYSRLFGDGADTPYTSIRGSADQFIGGLGIGYTF
ncbi:MipA/OmpV family protein [Erythrobacter sp. THAF29]|uniref:MipA/OmpV family protein n=1 Tax=Erythrobacter sp. THAF29 TaxID=2587851 RepID=UPI0012692C23|nr:MipA/OmpV family protein [Erythrobacter sp. THAF29]QFT78813.1 MltA-interacting protein MipA [Erythrobacter sp. THAF29]